MPELPEVETIVRGLREATTGRRILAVRLGKTDFLDDTDALEANLPGARIVTVERFGKFLALRLESTPNGNWRNHLVLLVHLGMTGQLTARRFDEPVTAHTHVFIRLENGREMRYTDIRRFGSIRLLRESAWVEFRARLGADPLEVKLQEFSARIESRRARIKALLLDQHVFRGMGNIYTDESLWRARLHPKRLGTSLKPIERERLFLAVQLVLSEAIRLRGSSVSDYVDAEGLPGGFQRRHCVYRREGKPCRRCGSKIRRVTVAGRSSYFCPVCQRSPRNNKVGAQSASRLRDEASQRKGIPPSDERPSRADLRVRSKGRRNHRKK